MACTLACQRLRPFESNLRRRWYLLPAPSRPHKVARLRRSECLQVSSPDEGFLADARTGLPWRSSLPVQRPYANPMPSRAVPIEVNHRRCTSSRKNGGHRARQFHEWERSQHDQAWRRLPLRDETAEHHPLKRTGRSKSSSTRQRDSVEYHGPCRRRPFHHERFLRSVHSCQTTQAADWLHRLYQATVESFDPALAEVNRFYAVDPNQWFHQAVSMNRDRHLMNSCRRRNRNWQINRPL